MVFSKLLTIQGLYSFFSPQLQDRNNEVESGGFMSASYKFWQLAPLKVSLATTDFITLSAHFTYTRQSSSLLKVRKNHVVVREFVSLYYTKI